jgi:hypothetical protein
MSDTAETPNDGGQAKAPTRVGVLFVHGIGEQKRFEFLESEVRNIAAALTAQFNDGTAVRVEVRTSPDAAFLAEQETWQADGVAPVMIEIVKKPSEPDKEITEIEFREAWWADLDEPTTLRSQVQFWWWALSMWTIRPKLSSSLGGFKHMRTPNNPTSIKRRVTFTGRVRLLVTAAIFLLILATFTWVNLLLARVLGLRIPGPEVIVNALGDVKLFQQDRRIGKGPLIDIGERPRVTLRRRMVRALVRMALGKYHRWYVFAHSQGTILSLNGLMEWESALPNYLDQALWKKCEDAGIGVKGAALTADQTSDMMPRRPGWLDNNDIISRCKLFKKLEGYMTYGSPLEKFVVLWPAIVPLNKDETVFNEKFKWINVYDATDPVAGPVLSYGPETDEGPTPQNISYKANSIHLLSHIHYLKFNNHRTDSLVDTVANWLLTGVLPPPAKNSMRWPSAGVTRFYYVCQTIIWLAIAWILGAFIAWLGKKFPTGDLSSLFETVLRIISEAFEFILKYPIWSLSSVLVITIVVGIVNWIANGKQA